MASTNQTSSEYVNHHLLHLSNAGDMPVGLFAPSIMNFDTLFGNAVKALAWVSSTIGHVPVNNLFLVALARK